MSGSSAASGTYQSSILAKNDMEEGDIHIFDTYTLSIGGCMLIKRAAQMAQLGYSVEEQFDVPEWFDPEAGCK